MYDLTSQLLCFKLSMIIICVIYIFIVDFTDLDKFGLNDNDDVFEEALKAVNTALVRTSTPEEVKAILDDPKAAKPEVSNELICKKV